MDGLYYPNVYQSVFSLIDAERVEVLKGPQGTLFGRNALGGVIQVVTREPSKEEVFKGSIAYESYRRIIASTYISGPLTPELSYSLSASKDHQGKGWGYNYTTNRDVAKTDYSSVRAKLKFEPSSSFKSMFTFEYGSSSNDLGTILAGLPGGVINGGRVKVDPRVGLYDSQAGPAGLGLDSESYGVQNATTYDLGAVTLKNLAQYRYSVLDGSWNSPGGPAGLLNTSQHRTDRIFTEEIQIGKSSSGRLSWVAGFFYMYYKSQYVNPGLLQQGSEISTGFQVNLSRQTVKSAAIFGQVSYEIIPRTTLTLGIRNSWESHRVFYFNPAVTNPALLPPIAGPEQTIKDSKPTWRVALDHRLSNDLMIYGSYNRGYKSGGPNPNAPIGSTPPIKAETIDAFELGLKSTWFDNRLRVNLDGFYQDYSNYQTALLQPNQFGGQTVIVSNAKGAKFWGLEFELEARPTDGLHLSWNGTYMDSKFKEFKGVPVVVLGVSGVGSTVLVDQTGIAVPANSKFVFTATAENSFALRSGATITPMISLFHLSKPNDAPLTAPVVQARGYDLVNASITYRPSSEKWSARLYVNNVFDKEVASYTVSRFGAFRTPIVAPRTIGGSLNVTF